MGGSVNVEICFLREKRNCHFSCKKLKKFGVVIFYNATLRIIVKGHSTLITNFYGISSA